MWIANVWVMTPCNFVRGCQSFQKIYLFPFPIPISYSETLVTACNTAWLSNSEDRNKVLSTLIIIKFIKFLLHVNWPRVTYVCPARTRSTLNHLNIPSQNFRKANYFWGFVSEIWDWVFITMGLSYFWRLLGAKILGFLYCRSAVLSDKLMVTTENEFRKSLCC
jgi:hypothetical protein